MAVLMLVRLLIQSARMPATGSGTGLGGSPSRSKTSLPSRITSSRVSRTMWLARCA